jgi:NAD(P)-dependent dehydrogenase (short-subunit alcohol dehydrogenase family)
MKDKIVMVTGATAGIGKVTARELARQGAEVIVVGRSREKCETITNDIRTTTGNPNVTFRVADLSSQSDIRRLAADVQAQYQRLDVLVNNAGAVLTKRSESADGIEMTFALNHLNYFLLTHLLLPALHAAPSARIVNVASDAHMGGNLNFDDLEYKQRRYNAFAAYAQSKLANIMFTYELAHRLQGTTITANALHPGFVSTRFGANNGGIFTFIPLLARIIGVNEDKGAETSIYLASSPDVEGVSGAYYSEGRLSKSKQISYDRAAQQRLWEISAQMTGIEAESRTQKAEPTTATT